MTNLTLATHVEPMADLTLATHVEPMTNLIPATTTTPIFPIKEYSIPEQVQEIYANGGSNTFAMLKHDGSVVTVEFKANTQPRESTIFERNALAIYPTKSAFVILEQNGSVYSRGQGDVGYPMFREYAGMSGIETMNALRVKDSVAISTHGDNVAVLKRDGGIKVWGNLWGNTGSDIVGDYKSVDIGDSSVGLSVNGSVAQFRREYSNGRWTNFDSSINRNIVASANNGLLYLESDGSVFRVVREANRLPKFETIIDSGAIVIQSNLIGAIAILKSNGAVVTFGDTDTFGRKLSSWAGRVRTNYGGDSTAVAEQLKSGVRYLYHTDSAFAALKTDGSVVTWGLDGGDSSSVSNLLSNGVISIYSTAHAFAALKADGSVVTWGAPRSGGDSSLVASNLTADVKAIYSNSDAFAALKEDGSVITWGEKESGGNSYMLHEQLHNVISITAGYHTFAAIKADGTVIMWGADGHNATYYVPRTKAYASDLNKDTDGDGLTDAFEMSFCDFSVIGNIQPCLDPGKWDTDGDGVSDGKEYKLDQNPLNKDSNLMNSSQYLALLPDGNDGVQDIDQDGYPDGWRLH
ncbi:hypothetical protein VEZ01S_06_00020 [Vibrio ezurae NBRC 102218]|uniref:Uncharacterized protein n=2 Tax=Vibrio ezurae TaxID=252583 RepID=U3AFZ4_9VIBR|nr:hypothetical protein VEZ01S_06_00020 [Vibrio ezurae NBRC 102218]